MLPTLLVLTAVAAPAAPIPRDAVPNTIGPAPRIVAVKSDANGTVWITAQVWEKRKTQHQFFVLENGKQVMKQQEVEQTLPTLIYKSLGDFGAKFHTAEGTTVSTEEATKRVKDGAALLVTADGKPIDRTWLRAVHGDTVVMQVEGLAHAHFQYSQYDTANSTLPKTASPRLALFSADDSGAVRVSINPNAAATNANNIYYDDLGGRVMRGRAIALQGNLEINSVSIAPQASTTPVSDHRQLLDAVKFDAYDTRAKLIPRSEALKRLKAGGLVLLAGDNKFPDSIYLKAFRDDVLVLVSAEFVFPQGIPNPYDMRSLPGGSPPGPGAANPVIRPAPALGIVPPVVQFRAGPAVVEAVPIVPPPKAKPAIKAKGD